jgi:hypothetical protein
MRFDGPEASNWRQNLTALVDMLIEPRVDGRLCIWSVGPTTNPTPAPNGVQAKHSFFFCSSGQHFIFIFLWQNFSPFGDL